MMIKQQHLKRKPKLQAQLLLRFEKYVMKWALFQFDISLYS